MKKNMSDRDPNKNILRFRRPIRLNIGIVIFAIVLIYFLVYLFNFLSAKHVSVYEVEKGKIMKTIYYTGLILRTEEVTYADDDGWINYYSKEGERAGYDDLICSIDEEGSVSSMITAAGEDGTAMSREELLSVQGMVTDYTLNYADMRFYDVYSFRENLNASVQGNLYRAALEQFSDLVDPNVFFYVCAQTDGVLAFYTDGFETVTTDTFSADMYQPSSYIKENLKANATVESGQALYKMVTDENWYMLIPLNEEEKEMYQEEMGGGEDSFVINVTFKQDDAESNATAQLRSYDDNDFLQLAFNSSMVRYISSRYMEVGLDSTEKSGLKIPNSAIVEKEFLLVPKSYVTSKDNSSDEGVTKVTKDKHGRETTEFVSADVYHTDEESGFSYIDAEDLAEGDIVQMPDSSQQYEIRETGTLSGVYNMNKGYAVFKMIEPLISNEEYTVVASGTDYGISLYDRIAQNGTSVKEGEFAN